jgi:Domain of unknown function (DUF1929)
MNMRRLITIGLMLALSACTTPPQDSSQNQLQNPDDAPLVDVIDGSITEVNFDLLRPTAAPANLLASPNDLSVAAWLKGPGITVQANAEPNLSRVTANSGSSYIGQRSGATAAGTYSARAFLKGSGTILMYLQRSGGDYAIYARQSVVLSSAGVLVTVTVSKPADGYGIQLGIGDIQSNEQVLAGQAEMVFGGFETTTPPNSSNLVIEGSNFAASAWYKGFVTVQANVEGNFDQITSSSVGFITQRTAATAAGTYTGRMTLKGSGSVQIFLQRGDGDFSQYNRQYVTLGAQAVQVSVSAQKPNDGSPVQFGIASIDAGDVIIAGLSELVLGSGPVVPTVTGVSLSANPSQIAINQSAQLQATVTGTGAFSSALTLTSTPAGATISANPNGNSFTSSTPGTYTITATSTADPSKSATATVTVSNAAPSTSLGAWSGVLPLPVPPIHAGLLSSGKILFWAYDEDSSTNTNKRTQTFLWDPIANDTPLRIDNPNSKLFCSGHSFLPDGRLLTIGGLIRPTPPGTPQLGTKDTNLFNPSSSTWSKAADMNIARYYPSSVPLANGDVLAIAGSNDTNGANIDTPEVWQTNSGLPETDPGKYRLLSNGKFSQGWYPMAFQAPNGKVFNVGPQPTMGYLDPNGTGTWTSLGDRVDPANDLGNGRRTFGNAVMYEPGKIALIGGADPPTNTAMTININGSSPAVTQVGSMTAARRQQNATILPDGTVLVTGGTSGPGFNDATRAVLTTELWNPATGQFKTLKNAATPRLYHSVALLMPDARVLSAGGDGSNAPSYPNAEIFTPPYLLNSDGTPAARPSIISAPSGINYNSSFAVATGNTDIARVTLVKLSSVTHSTNFDQRFLNLSFSKTGSNLSVSAPSNGNVAPPGYYMLFALNAAGVPSTSKILRLN